MARQSANLTIDELEKQFHTSRDNIEALLSLDHELSHRKRRRAKALHVEVVRRINELTNADTRLTHDGHPDLFED